MMNTLRTSTFIISLILSYTSFASNLNDFIGGGGSASSGPTWAGYTASSFNANMGTIMGMNAKCEADFSGSHACTYDEILKLGSNFPNSVHAWIIDGSYASGTSSVFWVTKDGTNTTGTSYGTCLGWTTSTNSSSSYLAPYMNTNGRVYFATCNNTYKIPCCK